MNQAVHTQCPTFLNLSLSLSLFSTIKPYNNNAHPKRDRFNFLTNDIIHHVKQQLK